MSVALRKRRRKEKRYKHASSSKVGSSLVTNDGRGLDAAPSATGAAQLAALAREQGARSRDGVSAARSPKA